MADPAAPQTRGRVLRKAALVYDWLQPLMTLGSDKRLARKVGDCIDIQGRVRILDVGCGTGILTLDLAERFPAGSVIGLDASPEMIRVATRKRSRPNCRFEIGLAEALPFGDNEFDAVVSSLFFHHVDADLKRRSLAEIRRVLRPGGRIVIADMGPPYTMFGRLLSYGAWLFFRQPEILENIRGMLPKLIAESGFRDIQQPFRAAGYILAYSALKED